MERVHLILKVYPDSTEALLLFWSEFLRRPHIEYRYNYLFTHKVTLAPPLRRIASDCVQNYEFIFNLQKKRG